MLLVEPAYYSRYPPLGLLKLATHYKSKGDSVELVKGENEAARPPDLICVTSLFSYAWKPVHVAVRTQKRRYPHAKVVLGGIYASLLPDHAAKSGADRIHVGLVPEAENVLPDYSLVPQWNGSILFASRGCVRNCGFCAVPTLEGKLNSLKSTIRNLIYPKHTKVILWDNNILSASNRDRVFEELRELKLTIDCNQGLDSRLVTPSVAYQLSSLKTEVVRLAYDHRDAGRCVENAIRYLSEAGIRRRKIVVYALYNYTDSPDDFFERIRDLLEWGVVSYPMRYEPLNSLKKNEHVSPKWTRDLLEMVADARRVLGTHGAFPPYEGLRKKFLKAADFQEAFALWPPKRCSSDLKQSIASIGQETRLLPVVPVIRSRKVSCA